MLRLRASMRVESDCADHMSGCLADVNGVRGLEFSAHSRAMLLLPRAWQAAAESRFVQRGVEPSEQVRAHATCSSSSSARAHAHTAPADAHRPMTESNTIFATLDRQRADDSLYHQDH